MEDRGTSQNMLYVFLAVLAVVVLVAFLVWTLVLARNDGDRNRGNLDRNGDAPPVDPPPGDGNPPPANEDPPPAPG